MRSDGRKGGGVKSEGRRGRNVKSEGGRVRVEREGCGE